MPRALIVLVPSLLFATPAFAFTIEGLVAEGCHERITSEALRTVRAELEPAHPLPLSDDELAIVQDVQFRADEDMRDLGGITLLIAVRDNDLKGRGAGQLSQLATVHGDPDGQREHCLKRPEHTEPGGSELAIADCRAFIKERVRQALDGLDASGEVNLESREEIAVHLELRKRVKPLLPTFYVRMGQALHALEDSFTHTYRTPDLERITVVLNWVKLVDHTLFEKDDGPPHSTDLDACGDDIELNAGRREAATRAATEVLRVALDPRRTKEQRIAEIDAMVDRYTGFQPGCDYGNQWCDAQERLLAGSCGCDAARTAGGPGSVAAVLGLIALALSRTRRRAAAVALLGVILAAAGTASAADGDAESDTPSPTFGLHAAVAGSYDEAAFSGTVGGRLRLSDHWAVAVDAEWNPWVAIAPTHLRGGVVNFYGTIIFRAPFRSEDLGLRVAASVGSSTLLTSLYGAPAGTTGMYFGLSPVALEWRFAERFFLIFTPFHIAAPAPQLTGVPLIHRQYRTAVAIEMDL